MLLRIIAFNGKGSAGKSAISSNLGFDLANIFKKEQPTKDLIYIDFDSITRMAFSNKFYADTNFFTEIKNAATLNDYLFEYSDNLKNLKFINLTNDLNNLMEIKEKFYKFINDHLENNTILINLPGNNALDIFMEIAEILTNLIVITYQEKSAFNTVAQLLIDMYLEMEQRNIYNPNLYNIHMLYNMVGNSFAKKQFNESFGGISNRWNNKDLFKPYKEALTTLSEKRGLDLTFNVANINWKENDKKADISITPMYHVEKDAKIATTGMSRKIFMSNFIDTPETNLPLSALAIRRNARLINSGFTEEE